MRRLPIAGFLACQLLAVGAAIAAEPFAPTAAEMRLLPAYCAERIKGNASGVGIPAAEQMGRANWLHIHHYCYAVNFVNRAAFTHNAKDRAAKLQEARNNYRYVIRGAEPRFPMRPQIYTELGKVDLRLHDVGQAMESFAKAIEFNPAYEPAYLALIDVHREAGRNKEALEVATAGLRHLPDSEPLQNAYLATGGKRPFPEPVEKAAPAPSGAAAQKTGPERAEVDGAGDGVAADATKPAEDAGPASMATTPSPETGCRFCPPEDVQRRWRGTFKGGKE